MLACTAKLGSTTAIQEADPAHCRGMRLMIAVNGDLQPPKPRAAQNHRRSEPAHEINKNVKGWIAAISRRFEREVA